MVKLIDNLPLDFTVAIPTYNGAERLPKVLDRLLNQTGLESISWEIIIINNNSQDNTSEVIKNYQNSWNSNCLLRCFVETNQGIAFARQRAVNEARGQLIGFLDDDMLPATDWVAQAVIFGKEYPKAGAYGGQIHGDFEIKPPDNFSRIATFLAIRERGSQPNLYNAITLSLPPGAALVVRKQAWCENVPQKLVLLGRLGKSMLSGDDFEALLYIHKANWEIWYNPNMHSYHQIPKHRLEKDYLLNLARGCGLSIFHLRLINTNNWQKPLVFFKIILGNLRRILNHFIKYKVQVKNDLIASVEIQFYLAMMISPFYSLRFYFNNYKKR